MQIGRADTLGSGVRNLYTYAKMYSESEPILEEGDIFKTKISLIYKDSSNSKSKYTESDDAESKVIALIKEKKKVSALEIQETMGFKSRTSVHRIISKLLSENKIKKYGEGKNTVYSQG